MSIDKRNKYFKEDISEEVQEIFGHVPNWLTRWGISIILFIILGLLVGTWLFKYRETVSCDIVITTKNTPAPLVSKANGEIKSIFIKDGGLVEPGSYIALIENSASIDEIVRLNELFEQIGINWEDIVLNIDLPVLNQLGEIQKSYTQFKTLYNGYKYYLQNNFILKKIEILNAQIDKQNEYYKKIKQQRKIKAIELNIIRSSFLKDSTLYSDFFSAISLNEMEQSKRSYIQNKSSYINTEAALDNIAIKILNLKDGLIDLEMRYNNDKKDYEISLDEAYALLVNQVNAWEEKYILVSPIKGKVTFTKYWCENQFVMSGERIASVVPLAETEIIGKVLIPSNGLGKVDVGQKVNIKLSGFPYSRYGILAGIINSISLVPEINGKGYYAEVALSKGMNTSYKEQLKFIQQMDGTADIITDESRIIRRFLDPIKALLDTNN